MAGAITDALTGIDSRKKYTQEEMSDHGAEAVSEFMMSYLSEEYAHIQTFGSADCITMPESSRRAIVMRSFKSYQINPISKQIIKLWTNYPVAGGVTFSVKTEDKPLAKNNKAKRKTSAEITLEAIVKNPKNAKIFSTFGQRKTNELGLLSGENFFAVVGKGKNTVYRRVDALQIYSGAYDVETSGIAAAPGDAEDTRFYVRTIADAAGNPTRTIVYRDWQNPKGEAGELSDGTRITVSGESVIFTRGGNDVTPENIKLADGVMYHWLFDGNGQRGTPLLNTSLAWCDAQGHFMKNRLAIMSAITQFAWDVKTKGGEAGVAYVKNKLASTLSATNSYERNPKTTAGGNRIGNAGTDFTAVGQETGADAARVDGDMIMNQSGVGAGISPGFLGLGNASNYAMANTMLGPLHRQFEAAQEMVEDLYHTLFLIAGIDVDVDTPELIRKDTPAVLDGLTKLIGVVPSLAASEELQRQILTLASFKNQDTIISEAVKAPKPEEPDKPKPKEPPE
jgi:hypothetical protein